MLVDELLSYLFDGQPHILAQEMRAWLGSSRRFTAFVVTSRNKIRKKLRVTQGQETLLDLRLELETAYLLLREKALSVAYEPEQSRQVRSPDFAVTYTTSLTFMVEVTRLRTLPDPSSGAPLEGDRLADAICTKLGQLTHGRSNVLVVGLEALNLTAAELQSTMLRVQLRAERNDLAFWHRYGFRERADFFRHYQRLSEVLVRGSQQQEEQPVIVWVNPQAKHPLPGRVRTALYRSHTSRV